MPRNRRRADCPNLHWLTQTSLESFAELSRTSERGEGRGERGRTDSEDSDAVQKENASRT